MKSRLAMFSLTLFSLALTACGGGSSDDSTDAMDAERSAPPTEVEVHAGWTGEVVPGLMVTLHAEVDEGSEIVDWAWQQSGGPDVSLEDADKPTARFRVPSVIEDTELGFTVTATDAAGATG